MSQDKKMGQIQVYTGDGKGKTTAALGLAIRAIGQGFKVGIIYFDKGGDYYGERKILDFLADKGLDYKAFGEIRMREGKGFRFQNIPADLQQAQLAADEAKKWMSQDYDLLILDEINTTVQTGLLKTEDILELLNLKPDNLELVLTGRNAPAAVLERADLVSTIAMTKHYISGGLGARRGIEY